MDADRQLREALHEVRAHPHRLADHLDHPEALEDLLPEHAELHLGGLPMIAVDMMRFIRHDLAVFGVAVLAVLALLVVFLKLLGRINRRMGGEEAGLEKVWPLGPRREIQVLRLGDEVHYIYRDPYYWYPARPYRR